MEPLKRTAGGAAALMGTLQFGLAAAAALGVSATPQRHRSPHGQRHRRLLVLRVIVRPQ